MKVAVIGSRAAPESVAVAILKRIPREATVIVSGGAAGVDSAAERVASALSLPVRRFLPDYKAWGQAAPMRRNDDIVDYADLVLAFWDGESAGTRYTVAECLRRGKPVHIVRLGKEGSAAHGNGQRKDHGQPVPE